MQLFFYIGGISRWRDVLRVAAEYDANGALAWRTTLKLPMPEEN